MKFRGRDLSHLPDQFQGCVQGRTLILDGDGPAYRAAATAKRLDTAIRRFQQDMLTQMFLTKSQDMRVHLTANTSHKAGRFLINAVKPYQGNRNGKNKPPLLEPLRQAIALRENWLAEYTVQMHHVLEADDGMMHDAYALKENGVIWSDDKDLRMTPYPYFDKDKGIVLAGEPEGWLTPKFTDAGNMKLIGQGPMFFWAQMLMGDQADNIQGIIRFKGKLCAPAGAYEALQGARTQHEAANIVLNGYREIDQNPLPEGWLLWLLRWPGDTFWGYVQSLEITDENRRFLDECSKRSWFRTDPQDSAGSAEAC